MAKVKVKTLVKTKLNPFLGCLRTYKAIKPHNMHKTKALQKKV